jgi:dipeptidyl aminopeptidase/acylaminoacyl peptidase
MRLLANCLGCLILWAGSALPQQAMTFDDLYGFDQVGDLQLSPDGKTLAFTLTHNDLQAHARSTYIYLLPADSGEARRLTDREADEYDPCWSPDGSLLAFSSGGENGRQIWMADSGDYRPLTGISTGAGGMMWFPDSRRFLFTSPVYPDCDNDACNRVRDSLAEENPLEARVYDRLLFRHYGSWADGKVEHLFSGSITDEVTIDLTPGPHDVPPVAGGGRPAYAISPDGLEICYAKNTEPVAAMSYNNDLYIIPAVGGNVQPIADKPGNDCRPFYSPDGLYLAYLEMVRPGYESEQQDIILYDRRQQLRKNLTEDFDRSVGSPMFSSDGSYIYFTAVDMGMVGIYRVVLNNGAVEEVLTDAVYGDLAVAPDGKALYFTRSTSIEPGDIYRYDLTKNELRRLTFYARKLTDRVALRPSEEFWFYSFDSLPIQGFLTLPPDFDPQKKYPLVLLIHGGPQWCWLNDFNYYGWNIHLLAAQGYAVAQINPRGSRGYGRKFCDAVSGDWGGKDYHDLMIGIDYLAGRFAYVDTTRMAALGRSYGGYMVNWICGHTDRFKCLVSVDGSFENLSDYYSTEELWFPEWEFQGTPWTNRELYLERSPEKFVANFKTPTLVVHGQKDYRVDVSQGLMMFTALQRMGVPSKLLYFPDEGHSVGKLRNLRYAYEVQLAWLAQWLK